jgi:hypothetical protein
MQYVILIYHGTAPLPATKEWEALPEADRKAIYAEYAALNKTPGLTPGVPLGLPAAATTVRVSGGKTAASSGAYADNREPLGGYFILEADDLDAAMAVAARVPAARLGGAVEVRPAAKYW